MDHGKYAALTLVTPKAVYNTVISDGQTRLWFQKLCFTPGVVDILLDFSTVSRGCFFWHRLFSFISIFSIIASVVICVVTVSMPQKFFMVLTISWFSFAVLAVSSSLWSRAYLARLSALLVERDHAAFPPGMTLYQMGEIYARKYQITSLVSTIAFWDNWLRASFLGVYFATFGMYFMSFGETLVWTLVGCLLAIAVVKVIILWRRG